MPTIKIEVRGLKEAAASVDPAIFEKASRRTVNEVAKKARTAISDEIRTKYTVKAGELKGRMALTLASQKNGLVRIRIAGKKIPLTGFTGTRQTQRGVSVEVIRGQRRVISHAFLLGSGSDRRVWWRTWRMKGESKPHGTTPRSQGAKLPKHMREPITQVRSVSAAGMFDQPYVWRMVEKLVETDYGPTMQRNIAFYSRQVTP